MSKNKIGFYGKDDRHEVKNFDTLDEFQRYYDLHTDEINQLSTFKLNKMYHIKDYKITRRKLNDGNEEKTLCFRKLFKSELTPPLTTAPTAEITSKVPEEFESRLSALESAIKNIKAQLIEIINVINGT